MRYWLLILVFAASASATELTPIGYQRWTAGNGLNKVQFGGMVHNYPDTDSTFAPIDNTFLTEGDSVIYNNTSILRARINKKGVATVEVDYNGTTYGIQQKPVKLILINTR